MTEYKSVIKRRIVLLGACCTLFSAVTALAMAYGVARIGDDHTGDFIRGVQAGVFLGLLLVMLFFVFRYSHAVRNEAALKKLFVEETDERNRFIRDKIGGMGINLSIGLIAAASVVAGYFDRTVFFTLLGTLAAVVGVKGALEVVYRRRF